MYSEANLLADKIRQNHSEFGVGFHKLERTKGRTGDEDQSGIDQFSVGQANTNCWPK